MKKRWFDRLIGCAFYITNDIVRDDLTGEYVFVGTCEHSDHDSRRDPLQYEFTDGKNTLLLDYKEARLIMGAIIDYRGAKG